MVMAVGLRRRAQACRRAAYEERRAASQGAIGLEVVDRVETREHAISVCVDRTIESPVGCRRVIYELTQIEVHAHLIPDFYRQALKDYKVEIKISIA
ncbi:MAG: hypothetical protein ABIR57_04525 [Aeromicrobium sp.]